jgi:hypothetical protein
MMLAALRPELFGPIIVAGSPLSYWAGVRGKYPMRYTGGLLGGSWLTAFASDLGHGRFDGAWLVQNFENQNAANTLWTKQYNLYSKIDTEAPRYLNFERWWGGHVNLNAEEIQFIVDQLFIGNKLAAGRVSTSGGEHIDLRNIRSPIVVLCSKGDNITPPQQALGWILDLYESVDEIRSWGQTIVYTVHENIGHLGIFVSGGVAKKEHGEFSGNIDLIDTLPPGLYEAVFEDKTAETANPDLATGNWVMRCEARTLADIEAMGGNDPADERRFATAARLSEINLNLYRTFLQPAVRACVTPAMADLMRRFHPLRQQYELLCDQNPFMAPIASLADQVRAQRSATDDGNPFTAAQEQASDQIVAMIEAWQQGAERWVEGTFMTIFGSPVMQAAVGLDPADDPRMKAAKNPLHRRLLEARTAELRSRISIGGAREAIVRALIYIGMGRGAVDERGFEMARRIRESHGDMSFGEFKAMVREQAYILSIDEDVALRAIPDLLPDEPNTRRAAFSLITQILGARGELSEDDR